MRLKIDTSNLLVTERNLNALRDNKERKFAPSFIKVTEHSGVDHKCTSAVVTHDHNGFFLQLTDPFGPTDRVALEDIQGIEVFWQ
jgi:hypothetical protein